MFEFNNGLPETAYTLSKFFDDGNEIETCISETSAGDVDYFQHWRKPIAPGFENLNEKESIALLYALLDAGSISREVRVCIWDSSEYRVTWFRRLYSVAEES